MKKFFYLFGVIVFLSFVTIIEVDAKIKYNVIQSTGVSKQEMIKFDNSEETIDINSNKKINPLWEEYQSLSEEEKKNWHVIPEKFIVEYVAPYKPFENNFFNTLDFMDSLPSKYDLRSDGGKNYVSPIKDQKSLGLCWAFTTNSSIESNILKLGLRDNTNPAVFSERHLDYLAAKPTDNVPYGQTQAMTVIKEGYNPYNANNDLASGGNFALAATYMGLGFSPVDMTGSWSTYFENHKTISLSELYNPDIQSYAVTDYVQFPYLDSTTASDSTKLAWRNMIKEHVRKYGSVYVGTAAPQQSTSGACYIADNTKRKNVINWNNTCNYYDNGNSKVYSDVNVGWLAGTHAMSIIGWDDDYELSYCAYAGSKNELGVNGYSDDTMSRAECAEVSGTYHEIKGAWILKNSWGNEVNQYGYPLDYVYLAYDSYIQNGVGGVINTVEKDFDNTYNLLGPISYEVNSNDYSFENTYYKTKNVEKLKRISFETYTNVETEYFAYVQNNLASYMVGSITVDKPGRYSINIRDDISESILDENYFSIKILPSDATADRLPENIYTFTDNTTDVKSATTIVEYEYDSDSNKHIYWFLTRTSNIANSDILTYKIKDLNGNDHSSYFEMLSPIIVANAFTGGLSFTYNPLPLNQVYYIETYLGDQLLGVDSFATGINLDGEGTQENPYKLRTIDDFEYLSTYQYFDSTYELVNDIDLSNIDNFKPLGIDLNNNFRGYLYGNGHAITGLKQNGDYTGLFYKLGGFVNDLKLLNISQSVNKTGGGLATYGKNIYTTGVYVDGNIEANYSLAHIGGIIGEIEEGSIIESVTKTKIVGGVSGSFVGFLGEYGAIVDSFNIGFVDNYGNSVSTFAGSISRVNNALSNLIDFSQTSSVVCETIDDNIYDYITVEDVYYYADNKCEYIGEPLTLNELKDAKNYTNFHNFTWNIVDGKYPTLRRYPIDYIESITANNDFKNIFVGDIIDLDVKVSPLDPTYPELLYKYSNTNIVKDGNKYKFIESGPLTILIESTDSSHQKLERNFYAFDNEFKLKLKNDKYITLKDELDIDSASSLLSLPSTDVDFESGDVVGTGNKISYIYNDTVVGEFIALVRGDITKDGYVGSDDIFLMKRYILELETLSDEQILAGDLSGDGISSANIFMMRRYILGLEGEL